MNALQNIPPVHEILKNHQVADLFKGFSRPLVVAEIRKILIEIRNEIKSLTLSSSSKEDVLNHVILRLSRKPQQSFKRVINATGVLIHTNLGRAPLAKKALEKALELSAHYSTVEFNLSSGKRGERNDHLESLLCFLTGAQSALVVNNNAAALFLILNTLAQGKKVIVSRGELIEIGNSFRIPDIMEKSGARLCEVGTTNKTKLRDYEKACSVETALILKIHKSNYDIVGFTEEVSLKELSRISKKKKKPLVFDAGSGYFGNKRHSEYAQRPAEILMKSLLSGEPAISQCIKSGADLVTFSGDKLLGGPQAGIIVGKRKWINLLKRNSLVRALRVDKLLIATLEETLKLHTIEKPETELPLLQLLLTSENILEKRARELKKELDPILGAQATAIVKEESKLGGGAMPKLALPSMVLRISLAKDKLLKFEENLRLMESHIPVVGRIHNSEFIIDLRTIFESELTDLKSSILDAYNRLQK